MFQELHEPLVANVVKETSNVRIDDPVYLPLRDPYKQCIQGVMWTASWTKSITEPEEVFFIDTFQDHSRRLLDDFVLQRSDPKRSHFAIRFRDVRPLGGLGPVRSAMNLSVQISDPTFKIFRVITPRLAIDSRRRLLLQIEETCAQ